MKIIGSFSREIDDIRVYFDGVYIHAFGEYGKFANKPDGTSLAHYRASFDKSNNSIGGWEQVSIRAVAPGQLSLGEIGFGDATLTKIEDTYRLLADVETEDTPYKVGFWTSNHLDGSFKFSQIALEAESGNNGWLNFQVQDAEFLLHKDQIYVFANWRDLDGMPGYKDSDLQMKRGTRVVGGLNVI